MIVSNRYLLFRGYIRFKEDIQIPPGEAEFIGQTADSAVRQEWRLSGFQC